MKLLILFGVLILGLCAVLVFYVRRREDFCSSCQSDGGGGLLPLMEPQFNLRECVKQLLLLEDHLSNPQKRCPDCIRKHCLTIEALAEEGTTLDKDGSCRDDCNDLARKMREIEKEIKEGKDEAEIAQELRSIRKPLMNKYFDV